MAAKNILNKFLFLFILFLFFNITSIDAHCDGINGPIVKAAKKALETKNINYVLIWVSKEDESAVSEIFQKAEEVRNLNEKVKTLADMYFFETVVRLHRKSEGEPYNGLRFSDEGINPIIIAADKALETENIEILTREYNDDSVLKELRDIYKEVVESKHYDINDINSGRIFVKNYIHYIHSAVKLTGGDEIHDTKLLEQENHTKHN